MTILNLLYLVLLPLPFSFLALLLQSKISARFKKQKKRNKTRVKNLPFLLRQHLLSLQLFLSTQLLLFSHRIQPFDILLPILDNLMPLKDPLVLAHLRLVIMLHHLRPQLLPLLLPLVRTDNSDRFVQNGSHIDELVADLLRRHHLKSRTFRTILPLALREIHPEMDTTLAVIDPYLHIVVTDTIYEDSLQMESRRELRDLQKTRELDRLINLSDLTHQTDERYVLQRRDVLL